MAVSPTADLLDGTPTRSYAKSVCRNIRVLHNVQPPTTPEEIEAASLQYCSPRQGAAQVDGARYEDREDRRRGVSFGGRVPWRTAPNTGM